MTSHQRQIAYSSIDLYLKKKKTPARYFKIKLGKDYFFVSLAF